MTVAETTVIHAGTAIVTVTADAMGARNMITTVATGIGVIVVALLQRAEGIRLTTGVAEVPQGALLRVTEALNAFLTEGNTKLLLSTHLLRRLSVGKGSARHSSQWTGLAASYFLLSLSLSPLAFISFIFLLISNSPATNVSSKRPLTL